MISLIIIMYDNKKILVTGGTGLMAYHLVPKLLKLNANVKLISHNRKIQDELKNTKVEMINGDLTEKSFVFKIMKDVDYVFHLAAFTGGLGRMSGHPASTITPNLQMDSNVFDAIKEYNIERVLYASCSCVYPDIVEDLSENKAWKSDPPKVHASYSWAKRMGEYQARSYFEEFGIKIGIVRPSNSYGPNDNFNPNIAHVIPALIIKAVKDKMNPFKIWGDGSPIREFIYACDVAEGMIKTMENYCIAEPINLASGEYVTIAELAKIIVEMSGYDPKIEFDTSKPNGQKRRVLTNNTAKEKIGFIEKTSLREELKKTIEWYKNKKND